MVPAKMNLFKSIFDSAPGRRASFRATLFLFCAIQASAFCAEKWHVKEAQLRFELNIIGKPTHHVCGYFAVLPDGGLLPGQFPVARAVTIDGRPLETRTLWHSPVSAMSIVFADPGPTEESVFVYVSDEKEYKLWRPDSGILPSAILASRPGVSQMADAKQLASFGRVGEEFACWNNAGSRRAPLSIPGDLAGRTRPGVFYLLAYLSSQDPGRTWVAPFTRHGETEVMIKGARLSPAKRIDKWGGIGQWVDVDFNLVRLDVFQTAPGTEGYFSEQWGGLMFLSWRTPNATMQELGGVRSEAVPMSGTSRMETRVLRNNEIARSGSVSIESVASRDGSVIACFEAKPAFIFWSGKETPLMVYDLRAFSDFNPANTRYTWLFENGAKAEGPDVSWLLPAYSEHRIKLAAESGSNKSELSLLIYSFGQMPTSYANPEHRQAYREAFLNLLKSYEGKPDDLATMDIAYWNNLLRCMEFGSGYDILLELFSKYSDAMRARLQPLQRLAFEEMFLDAASPKAPSEALKWAELFGDEAGSDLLRQKQLAIRRAEINAYYLDDLQAAKRLLEPLARGLDAEGQLAKIRLGDIAFMEEDMNTATRYYANVQNLVRHDRGMFSGIYDALSTGVHEKPVEVKKGPKTAAEQLKADRERFMKEADKHRQSFADAAKALQAGDLTRAASAWKLNSLLDASASENVRKLIEKRFWFEARQALDAWERELPLSKIGGDYILEESRLYLKSGNPKRAYKLLKAYCDQVDASSYLPESAKILIESMKELNMNQDDIKKYAQKLRERLKFHPVAEEIDSLLKDYED